MATKPACRHVSPIHFINGCSANGVNFTLTRIYTGRNFRIVLITNPIRLAVRRPGVGHVSIRDTSRVCRTIVGRCPSYSNTVLYTTITSFAPMAMTSEGVGHRNSRLIVRLHPARSVTHTINTIGHSSRFVINFTLRAGSRRARTLRGVHHGGFSFVMLGSLGSGGTYFNCSAGGVIVLASSNSGFLCPLGSGVRITRSVVSGLGRVIL